MSSSKAKLGGIYRINLSDAHFYVGRSVDIVRRAQTHLRHLKQGRHENTYMQRVYDQSHQFEWVVVLSCGDPLESKGAEQALLDRLVGTDGCVNLNPSAASGPGMTGKHHTDETKEKLREARSRQVFSDDDRQRFSRARMGNSNAKGHSHPQSAETRQKISNARKGMIFSESHRQAISVAKKGKVVSDEARQAMSRAGKLRWARVKESQDVRVRTR